MPENRNSVLPYYGILRGILHCQETEIELCYVVKKFRQKEDGLSFYKYSDLIIQKNIVISGIIAKKYDYV